MVSWERKERRHSQEPLEYTEELHPGILMKRSESSHRPQEPNNVGVLGEGSFCWLDHARTSRLVGKNAHHISRVLIHTGFLIDGNYYHSVSEQLLINHRQKTQAIQTCVRPSQMNYLPSCS